METEEFLEHFGVKGMKWGVRRSGGSSTKLSRKARKEAESSEDVKLANQARATIKKTGVHALSNKELQALVNRTNLENQYKALNSKPENLKKVKAGADWARTILSIGKLGNEAITFVNSPAGKAGLKAARKLATK